MFSLCLTILNNTTVQAHADTPNLIWQCSVIFRFSIGIGKPCIGKEILKAQMLTK
jgi:hypothetical protein